MSGIVYRKNNSNVSLTGTQYVNPTTGTMRLCVRDANGSIVKYGFTTNTSASKHSPSFYIGGKNAYLARYSWNTITAAVTLKSRSDALQTLSTSTVNFKNIFDSIFLSNMIKSAGFIKETQSIIDKYATYTHSLFNQTSTWCDYSYRNTTTITFYTMNTYNTYEVLYLYKKTIARQKPTAYTIILNSISHSTHPYYQEYISKYSTNAQNYKSLYTVYMEYREVANTKNRFMIMSYNGMQEAVSYTYNYIMIHKSYSIVSSNQYRISFNNCSGYEPIDSNISTLTFNKSINLSNINVIMTNNINL